MITKNGIITNTTLGVEDHSLMSFMLTVDFGGYSQGVGGYRLDEWNKIEKRCKGTAMGLDMVIQILDVLGVGSWEKLQGTVIRVQYDDDGTTPLGIGHFVKDKWLNFSDFTKSWGIK